MDLNWELAIAGAFIVVGVMEYVKGFFKAPSRFVRLVAVLFAAGTAVAVHYLPPAVLLGLMILALSQLGYQVIVEAIKKKLGL